MVEGDALNTCKKPKPTNKTNFAIKPQDQKISPIRKPELLAIFENAMRESGLSFLQLSEESAHPATYQIIGASGSYSVRVYIWNLSFGGRPSIPDEWRIQVTGIDNVGGQQFLPNPDGKTAILGWSDRFEVFAAYDLQKHLGSLGFSPSIQIRQPALETARINGLAHHLKSDGEVAFAVKPLYMGVYLQNMEELHTCGSYEEALRLLESICENPEESNELDIEEQLPEERRYVVTSTRMALRDTNFRSRVLTAYSHSCAMCGIQLDLLDAAHILPAALPNSTDDTSNGLALCTLHHRAFDRGFVTFDTNYHIHLNETMKARFVEDNLSGGLEGFEAQLLPTLELPPSRDDRPAAQYIQEVNTLRGWRL